MIKILKYDEKPITYIGQCVGNCYGSDTSNDTRNYKRGKQCIEDGHGRVLEYPSITMEIDDYSIKVIREFYTHIQGVTRTQESTRYVNMVERGYIIPRMKPLATEVYCATIQTLFNQYELLLSLGVAKEDASMVLPLAMKTKVVVKMNARALLHMAEVRMCSRAYWEFRDLMKEMKEEISKLDDEWKEIADMMKPKCEVVGFCTEKQCCGKAPRKEDR